MLKKTLYTFLFLVVVLLSYSFYMSPSLGGLLPGGKEERDKTVHQLTFDEESTGKYPIKYHSRENEPSKIELRKTFRLDSVVAGSKNDFEKVLKIQSWVQSQWKHDGDNVPEKADAMYILQEAQKGRRFRCVEYSLVASECLQSLGFITRGLGLMTRDINEVNYGAGHVLNEVYLNDLQKWVMIDPQYDVILTRNGIPLNAVELQSAIAAKEPVELINPNSTITKEEYLDWVGPYLYYFTTSLNKGPVSITDRLLSRKKELTLVPKGAENPKYFQRLMRLTTAYFTNSTGDFYPKPQ